MQREIVGFHHDERGEWIAELACGHQRHVRHRPPFQLAPWVVDEAGRQERIGTLLECGRCVAASDTAAVEWPAPLTAREVAAELGCTEDHVRALIREGELPTVACGVRPGLVPRHQLDAYLRRLASRRTP